jgi:hypothetical protein
VSGYKLALSQAPAPARAFIAARLVLGQLYLVKPRVTQACRLARVSQPYTDAAIDVLLFGDPELEARVHADELSLFEAAVLAKHPQPTLVDNFMAASAAELADLGKHAGTARVWDKVIIPNLR